MLKGIMNMKSKLFRAHWLLVGMLTLIVCLGLFCACDSGNPPTETTAPAHSVTNAPAEVTESPATESPTEAMTEAPSTEAHTEPPVTEPVTEAETLPADKPTDALVLTFCDTPLNGNFIDPNTAATFEVVQDGDMGSVLKLSLADS